MSLVPFLLIAFIGATAAIVVRGPERWPPPPSGSSAWSAR